MGLMDGRMVVEVVWRQYDGDKERASNKNPACYSAEFVLWAVSDEIVDSVNQMLSV